jgi:hypothetical protein
MVLAAHPDAGGRQDPRHTTTVETVGSIVRRSISGGAARFLMWSSGSARSIASGKSRAALAS